MWKLSFKDSNSLHSIQHNTQPKLKDSTDCVNKEIQRLILQGLDNAFKERTRFVHPHSFLKILCILQASIILAFLWEITTSILIAQLYQRDTWDNKPKPLWCQDRNYHGIVCLSWGYLFFIFGFGFLRNGFGYWGLLVRSSFF